MGGQGKEGEDWVGGHIHRAGTQECMLFRMGGCAHARVHVCKQLSRWAGRRACGRVLVRE